MHVYNVRNVRYVCMSSYVLMYVWYGVYVHMICVLCMYACMYVCVECRSVWYVCVCVWYVSMYV